MATHARAFEPVLPSEQDTVLAKASSRALAPHLSNESGLPIRLSDGTEVLIPPGALRLIVDVLVQMADGNPVTVIPLHAEMTTQQAADYLNVSRPYFVREILEKGLIPYRKLGTHRRILFQDLMAYKAAQEVRNRQGFQELTHQAQALGMGY